MSQGVKMVSRAVYQMSIVTFVASIIWISVGVYEALTTPAEINVSEEVLRPLNPNIDMELLMSLGEREQLVQSIDQLLIDAEGGGILPTNANLGSGDEVSEGVEESGEELVEEEIEEDVDSGDVATGSGTGGNN